MTSQGTETSAIFLPEEYSQSNATPSSIDIGSRTATEEGVSSCASDVDISCVAAPTREVEVRTCPTSALDVAEYILSKTGPISTMKLQKLVYYCQAWSLLWEEAPIFHEPIEAWANGPAVRELFDYHRGRFVIDHVLTGNPSLLSKDQRETVDAVLEFYGDKSAQWLIDLSHAEQPWIDARRGLPASARGESVISLESMAEYYGARRG